MIINDRKKIGRCAIHRKYSAEEQVADVGNLSFVVLFIVRCDHIWRIWCGAERISISKMPVRVIGDIVSGEICYCCTLPDETIVLWLKVENKERKFNESRQEFRFFKFRLTSSYNATALMANSSFVALLGTSIFIVVFVILKCSETRNRNNGNKNR